MGLTIKASSPFWRKWRRRRNDPSVVPRWLTSPACAPAVSTGLFAEQLASIFVAEYRKARLQHARRLLQQSPLTITEIAVASGFSSLGYFSRVYRAQFGRSPSRDRRRDRPVRHARRGGEGDC